MSIGIQNQDHRNNRVEAPRAGYAMAADKEKTAHTKGKSKQPVPDAADISFSAGEIGFAGLIGQDADGKSRDKGKTLTELQQEAEYTDVGVTQDYMTVMSHTMSEEDYKKLSEEGFHFASLDPEEAVTIVDRIKAELARSGQQIVGYTDDIDVDTLAAAVGSDVLARAIADSFRLADIPLTEENIADVGKAWDMASQLDTPTDGSLQYMIDNGLEPRIWDFYLAQNSGAGDGKSVDGEFLEDPGIRQQIEQVLEQAGMELNEENRQAADWLLERNLPLTVENLKCLKELSSVQFPVDEDAFARAVSEAVLEGQSPVHAKLPVAADGEWESIYVKAVKTLEYYREQYEKEQDYESVQPQEDSSAGRQPREDVTARRQLEEIRLRMTAEVNIKLLRSGFAIDTAPMEELITALREAEKAVAERYFPGDEEAVSKYENWNAVTDVMEELPTLPAQLIGTVRLESEISVSQGDEASSEDGVRTEATILSHFHAEGKALQEDYRRAGESYEALMTAPRSDLGDSIRKAFSNVDEILQDLQMEVTEENRRAVRILGYNHMEIDVENVERIREADAQVKSLIEKMTPAATLKMIRDGVNPLEQNFEQLNNYFDELPESYREQAESYSRYLYGLEQNKQITAEERDSYIGVYRLLRQIERTDGAAIGTVVNVQAQMQFSNLLSAVRSGKFRHMDVKATEEMGLLQDLVKKGEALSISEQISSAYERQRLDEMREAVQADSTVAAMLQRGEIPVNVENLLAAEGLLQNEGNPFSTLRKEAEKLRGVDAGTAGAAESGLNRVDGAAEDVADGSSVERESGDAAVNGGADFTEPTKVWEQLAEKEVFRREYDAMLTGLQAETEELTFGYAQNSLDVRALQLAHRQLGILGSLARNEEYLLPMYIGEELATVHLTLERGSTEKGGISIGVDFADGAHVEAHLKVKGKNLEGFLLGNTSEEVMKLKEASDIFYRLINENNSMDLETVELPVVSKGNIKVTGTSESNSQEEITPPENGMLYRVAELFLQAIR